MELANYRSEAEIELEREEKQLKVAAQLRRSKATWARRHVELTPEQRYEQDQNLRWNMWLLLIVVVIVTCVVQGLLMATWFDMAQDSINFLGDRYLTSLGARSTMITRDVLQPQQLLLIAINRCGHLAHHSGAALHLGFRAQRCGDVF